MKKNIGTIATGVFLVSLFANYAYSATPGSSPALSQEKNVKAIKVANKGISNKKKRKKTPVGEEKKSDQPSVISDSKKPDSVVPK